MERGQSFEVPCRRTLPQKTNAAGEDETGNLQDTNPTL